MTTTTVTLRQLETGVQLRVGENHTLVVTLPRPVRVRLTGMLFDSIKCFLLPGAMEGIRTLAKVYREFADYSVLVTGHTDALGQDADNDVLALERARMVAAYITDDVDVWLAMFDSSITKRKRWGDLEERHMLQAVPGDFGSQDAQLGDAVEAYQASRGLAVDGLTGPNTRRALIEDYMAIDGTTLPVEATLVVHGCGEHFPQAASDDGDGVGKAENRRVEIFYFPKEIKPPPPAEMSRAGDAEYPAWVQATTKTIDVSTRASAQEHLSDLHFVLVSRTGGIPLVDTSIDVDLPGGTQALQTDSEGLLRIEALPPGDYAVAVRIGEQEDRFFVPTLPPNLDPIRIPVDVPLG